MSTKEIEMSHNEASQSSEEDFSKPALYDDNDDSGSEFAEEYESEIEEELVRNPRSRSTSRAVSETGPEVTFSLPHRPSPKTKPIDEPPKKKSKKSRSERVAFAGEARVAAPARVEVLRQEALSHVRRNAPVSSGKRRARPKRKRIATPLDKYRRLLNHEIKTVSSPPLNLYKNKFYLLGNQIGSSTWTAEEKAKLFTAAERGGRYDFPAIARVVGSKSAYEVQEYLDVIQKSIEARGRGDGRRMKGLNLVDIPAAKEISQECCEVLEKKAQYLVQCQEYHDMQEELEKWGDDVWLLSQDNISWITKDSDEKAGETVLKEVLPAATLFNTRNWLKLSRGVFMNSNPEKREEGNWMKIIKEGEEQGIYATALQDFHTLAVTITRRLVAAINFSALGRIKAQKRRRRNGKERRKDGEIIKADVLAAVDNLGLKSDSRDFWRTAARRNHLEVVDDDFLAKPILGYDEVESRLSERRKKPNWRTRRRGNSVSSNTSTKSAVSTASIGSNNSSAQEAEEDVSEEDEEDENSENDEEAESLREELSSDAQAARGARGANHVESSAEEAYMSFVESIDRYKSTKAEVKLWRMLTEEAPLELGLDIKAAREARLPDVFVREKDELETDKWRERVEYWTPWEHLDKMPKDDDFDKTVTAHSESKRARSRSAAEGARKKRKVRFHSTAEIESESENSMVADEQDEADDEDDEHDLVEPEEHDENQDTGDNSVATDSDVSHSDADHDESQPHRSKLRPDVYEVQGTKPLAKDPRHDGPCAQCGNMKFTRWRKNLSGEKPPADGKIWCDACYRRDSVEKKEKREAAASEEPDRPSSQEHSDAIQEEVEPNDQSDDGVGFVLTPGGLVRRERWTSVATENTEAPSFQMSDEQAPFSEGPTARLLDDVNQEGDVDMNRSESLTPTPRSPPSRITRAARASQRGASSQTASQGEAWYASPVFSSTQLDDLLGTQPMGSLPDFQPELGDSE